MIDAIDPLYSDPIYTGKGILLESPTLDHRIHEIVQFLLGREGGISNAWNLDFAKAVFVSENSEILRSVREEFWSVLQSCSTLFPTLSVAEEKLLEAFVGNVLALLPYTYPKEGESFEIPIKVEGVWKMVSYTIDKKIKLTPEWFSKPICGYGLISPDGPPLLTFIGTTFPAGEGFLAAVLSDFTPGMSIGYAPYLLGKKNLEEWMEGKKEIQLYGMSLGGSLSFQILRYHREQIGHIYAYNPAGLYFWDWGPERYDEGPLVHIFCQKKDLVPTIGRFPSGKNVHIYHVDGTGGGSFIHAHFRIFTGGEKVSIFKGNVEHEHRRWMRITFTALHFVSSFVTFPMLLTCFLMISVVGRVLGEIQQRLSSDPSKGLLQG